VLIDGLGSGGFTNPQKIEPKAGEPRGQLYNLASDLGQERNVYAQHPEIVRRLRGVLERYQEQGHSRPAHDSR
jgi:hypothetical protein